jgi:hypothetical protein
VLSVELERLPTMLRPSRDVWKTSTTNHREGYQQHKLRSSNLSHQRQRPQGSRFPWGQLLVVLLFYPFIDATPELFG